MHKIILLLTLTLITLGCKKLDKLTQFDMTFDQTVVIPSSSGINLPFNVLTPDVETNSESTFEVNDTRKDLIDEISLKTLELRITSPSNADFSFLKSINLYLNAEGLDEVKIAWKESVPSTATTLQLEVTDTDLKEYIKADNFSLRLNTETDEFLTSDYHIQVHSVFFVNAKILGL